MCVCVLLYFNYELHSCSDRIFFKQVQYMNKALNKICHHPNYSNYPLGIHPEHNGCSNFGSGHGRILSK
uniref:Uncharacterized protein n=1 Tax=Anguilla anguilla TaxID=7936 RepID=A0A0E9WQF0_ANGAN